MFTLSTPQSRQAGTRQRPRAKCHWHFNVLMKMRAKRKARAAKEKRTNKNMLKILWNCYKNSQQSPSESSPPSPTSSSSTSSPPSPLTRATNSLWQGAVFNFYTLLKAAQGLSVFMSCYDFILQHFGLRLAFSCCSSSSSTTLLLPSSSSLACSQLCQSCQFWMKIAGLCHKRLFIAAAAK